ncbi:MAG: tRNA pseudouridine(55) synthase TruB [Eubacteriales bacterium]|nr:tRNA pseudouridine(55) synthase TruB [Eubacteriales bacterium]
MNGIVCINKRSGMTSSDVVVKVRNALSKATGEKQKAGHFGTLDPDGMGVLVIGIGNSARLFDYTLNKQKMYRACFVFGSETDTLDASGEVVAMSNVIPSAAQIKDVLPQMQGRQMQMPPKYSALSVGGVKAYKLARSGKDVELSPREIDIFEIKMNEDFLSENSNEFEFTIRCSSGTYVRSIARDMAKKLGTLGYMKYIIREQSGTVNISDCITLEEFLKSPIDNVKSNEIMLKDYEHYELKNQFREKALNGVRLKIEDLPTGIFVLTIDGANFAMAEKVDGCLKIRTRI